MNRIHKHNHIRKPIIPINIIILLMDLIKKSQGITKKHSLNTQIEQTVESLLTARKIINSDQ